MIFAFESWLEHQSDSRFLTELAAHFQISSVHRSIIQFLKTQGVYSELGKLETPMVAFDGVVQENFPAIRIGDDHEGTNFWLMLETGLVITLHQDTDYLKVGQSILETGTQYVKKFTEAGALLTFNQLNQFLQYCKELPAENPRRSIQILRNLFEATTWNHNQIVKNIEKLPMEFVMKRVREHLDPEMLKTVLRAEKKWSTLREEDPQYLTKLDVSQLLLAQFPEWMFQFKELKEINLSGNPDLIVGNTLQNFPKLQKLIAKQNDWSEIPPLPAKIQIIDLSQNRISSVDSLFTLTQLKELKLLENPTADQDGLERLKVQFPKCKIVVDVVKNDMEVKSISFHRQNLKNIPKTIVQYRKLEELDLSGNHRLNWSETIEVMKGLPNLRKINFVGCGLSSVPEDLHELKSLEEIVLTEKEEQFHYENYNFIESREQIRNSLQTLAKITNLKIIPYNFFSGKDLPLDSILDTIPEFKAAEAAVISQFSNQDDLGIRILKNLAGLPHLKKLHLLKFSEKLFPEELIADPEIAGLLHRLEVLTWDHDTEKLPALFLHAKNLTELSSCCVSDQFLNDLPKLLKLRHLIADIKHYTPEFPGKLGECGSLESLFLSNFNIHSFHTAFDKLSNLKSLEIHTNRTDSSFVELSSDFANLKSLESLKLHFRYLHLSSVSPEFCQLPKLKELELKIGYSLGWEKSGFTLPDTLQSLQSLETLLIEGDLKNLPASLHHLQKLKELKLNFVRANEPFVFPEGFGNIPSLEKLHIHGIADFHSFTPVLPRLTGLQELILDGKWINGTVFPPEIKNCTNLQTVLLQYDPISLQDNEEKSRIESLSLLPNLRKLGIKYINWSGEADFLKKFQKIDTLVLSLQEEENEAEKQIFVTISEIPTIKHLVIESVSFQVENLPDEMGLCQQLETLTIGHWDSKMLSQGIKKLQRLKEIRFVNCRNEKQLYAEVKKFMPFCTFV